MPRAFSCYDRVMKGYRYYARKFLNKPGFHAGAYVLASVRTRGSLELVLSDCDRVVSFSLETYGETYKNTLFKVDTLLQTLTEFRAAMVEQHEEDKNKGNDSYYD